jgi:TRAP-type transport system periplasmic protein
MKKTLGTALCMVLALGIFTTVSLAAEIKPVTLRVSSAYPPPESALASKHLVIWEEMVTQKTKGAVTFKNYWGASLGKPAEHLPLVQTGAVDLVVSYGWYTPSKLPLDDFDYVFPFGPTDPYIITKACRQMYEEFPDFKKDLAKNNATRVFQSPGLNFVFLSKKPVTKLSDFTG